MTEPAEINLDTLKAEEFEQVLPELFATCKGKLSEEPRLQKLYAAHPNCLALVRDLETIAETARSLVDEPEGEPSDKVWDNIRSKLEEETGSFDLGDEEESLNDLSIIARKKTE